MPFAYTCTDHPTWRGTVLGEVSDHVHADHAPGTKVHGGPIQSTFTDQAVAQGNPLRYRFLCRRCNTQVDTTTPPPRDAAYCEECK